MDLMNNGTIMWQKLTPIGYHDGRRLLCKRKER